MKLKLFAINKERTIIPFIVFIVSFNILIGGIIIYLETTHYGTEKGLLLVLGILLIFPIILSLYRCKQIDIFEPIYAFLVGYSFFLFIRPLYILLFNDFIFLNTPYGGGAGIILPALGLIILGLFSFYLGYYTPLGQNIGRSLPPIAEKLSSKKVRNYGFLIIIIGFLLYKIFEFQVANVVGNVYQKSTAYLYLGIDIVGVGVFFLFLWIKKNPNFKNIFLFLIVSGYVLYDYMVRGARYRTFYLVLVIFISYYLLSEKRISFRKALAFCVLFFVYIAGVGYLRGGGNVTIDKWSKFNFAGVFGRFFSSSGDLNIFDVFTKVIISVPEKVPYQIGRTFLYLFVHPIPRIIWSGKPLPTETLINRTIFAGSGPVIAGSGYAYSMPGSCYIEGGIVGVFIGMFIFGLLCRILWAYHKKYNNIGSKMLLAISLPIVFLFQRGGYTANDTVWYLIYLIPSFIGLIYARVRK